MITEGIIIALITGMCAIIGQWMITRSANKQADNKRSEEAQKRAVEQAVKDTALLDRLRSIESKLVEHNGYAEKFAASSEHLAEIDKAIVSIKKDLEYLKQKGA